LNHPKVYFLVKNHEKGRKTFPSSPLTASPGSRGEGKGKFFCSFSYSTFT